MFSQVYIVKYSEANTKVYPNFKHDHAYPLNSIIQKAWSGFDLYAGKPWNEET
jgi:hypothetical protein